MFIIILFVLLLIIGCGNEEIYQAEDLSETMPSQIEDFEIESTGMDNCVPSIETIDGVEVEILGSETMGCEFAGLVGTCEVCLVSYTRPGSINTCFIPEYFFEQIPDKYTLFIGEELDYCTEELESNELSEELEEQFPLLITLSDMGPNYTYAPSNSPQQTYSRPDDDYDKYEMQMSNYDFNMKIYPSLEGEYWIRQEVRVFDEMTDLSDYLPYIGIGGTELDISISDESQVYQAGMDGITLWFRKDLTLVKLEIIGIESETMSSRPETMEEVMTIISIAEEKIS